MTKEEKRKKHLSDLNKARVKRFREKHADEYKRIGAELPIDIYHKFTTKLKEQGITQKQFIENAIDKFLSEG